MFARREIAIAADPSRLYDVRTWAASAAAEFGLPPSECEAFKLAMSEAVSNAIEHGSARAEDSVRITIAEEKGALVCEVMDSGRTEPADDGLTAAGDRGRGLEIVALVMDSVELRPFEAGSMLRFTKARAAAIA